MSLEENLELLLGPKLFTGKFLFPPGQIVSHTYWSYPELKVKSNSLILFQILNLDQDCQKGSFSLHIVQTDGRIRTNFSVCPWSEWVLYCSIENQPEGIWCCSLAPLILNLQAACKGGFSLIFIYYFLPKPVSCQNTALVLAFCSKDMSILASF